VKLQIWDTAGEEKFRSITPMYYKNAGAVALIYDSTSEESFISIGRWVSEIENNGAGFL
jgi:GTPase SAR1 family protein